MNALNVILIVLLVAAIVTGVAFGIVGSRELGVAQSALEETEREVETIREELTETKLKYRGVVESRHNIPDSLRNTSTGQWLTHSREYAKRIRGLKAEVKEAERQNRKRERALADVRRRLTQRLLMSGGVAVLAAGALVARRRFRP
jgi:hypothetical protein